MAVRALPTPPEIGLAADWQRGVRSNRSSRSGGCGCVHGSTYLPLPLQLQIGYAALMDAHALAAISDVTTTRAIPGH